MQLRKILLHAGTPKTGTTSLQVHLHSERHRLRQMGTLYPGADAVPAGSLVPFVPKHQWSIRLLLSDAPRDLLTQVNAIHEEEGRGCDRMILSCEGLFNHWGDIRPAGHDILRALAEAHQVEMCVWFREPVAYVRSYYCQILKNPPENYPLYGRDITVDALLDDPWFKRHLEYDRFIDEVSAVLGPGSVRPFAYANDTIQAFCGAYGIPLPENAVPRENTGLRSFGVDALRALNRHCGGGVARANAVADILQLDANVSSRVFALSTQETSRVEAMSERGVAALRQRFGIELTRG